MTDRIKGFVVSLEENIREDEIQPTLTALRMIHNVRSVTPQLALFEDHLQRERGEEDLAHLIIETIQDRRGARR